MECPWISSTQLRSVSVCSHTNYRQLPSTTDNYRQQAEKYRQQAEKYRQQAEKYRQQAEKYRQQAEKYRQYICEVIYNAFLEENRILKHVV